MLAPSMIFDILKVKTGVYHFNFVIFGFSLSKMRKTGEWRIFEQLLNFHALEYDGELNVDKLK